jgi:hypothetical protein
MPELLLPSLFVAWGLGKGSGRGGKSSHVLSQSVSGGSNHCSESGRGPNDTCCSLFDANKQTKPRARERKERRALSGKGGGTDKTGAEKTRRGVSDRARGVGGMPYCAGCSAAGHGEGSLPQPSPSTHASPRARSLVSVPGLKPLLAPVWLRFSLLRAYYCLHS